MRTVTLTSRQAALGKRWPPRLAPLLKGVPVSTEAMGARQHVGLSASDSTLWSGHSVDSILKTADQLCRMLAKTRRAECALSQQELQHLFPDGLVVRIRRSHRRGRGSIPRLGVKIFERTKNLQNLVPCNKKRLAKLGHGFCRQRIRAARPQFQEKRATILCEPG